MGTFWTPRFSIFGDTPDGTLSDNLAGSLETIILDQLFPDNENRKVFNLFFSYNDGNFFILKGCGSKIPAKTLVSFKLTNVMTP